MPQDDLLRQKIANLQSLWNQLTEKLTGKHWRWVGKRSRSKRTPLAATALPDHGG